MAGPCGAAENIAWGRACYDAAEPFLEGVYANYLGDEGEPRVGAAYAANYERLAELKTRYDPTNLLRLNQNVTPVQGPRPGSTALVASWGPFPLAKEQQGCCLFQPPAQDE